MSVPDPDDELVKWAEIMLPAWAKHCAPMLEDAHGPVRLLFELGRQWERQERKREISESMGKL